MSKIFLPNGGHIVIHTSGWTETTAANGSQSYSKKNEDGTLTYLGVITASGVVHLTDLCSYTYYPPAISSLQEAYKIISSKMKDLCSAQCTDLKNQLKAWNSKSGYWK